LNQQIKQFILLMNGDKTTNDEFDETSIFHPTRSDQTIKEVFDISNPILHNDTNSRMMAMYWNGDGVGANTDADSSDKADSNDDDKTKAMRKTTRRLDSERLQQWITIHYNCLSHNTKA